MKILHVNSYDSQSARFDGQHMAPLLEAAGHEFMMAVGSKSTLDPRIDWLHFRGFGRLCRFANRLEWALGLQSWLYPTPLLLMTRPALRRADVVHLHLIHNNFFSLFALPRLCRIKPVVWTIHDLWALTGHCNYPVECVRWKNGCGECPDIARPHRLRKDTTAWLWRAKQRLYKKLNLDLIVASKWMDGMLAQSPLLSAFRRHLIPHGIDTDFFRPLDKQMARQRLGLSQDASVLTFRAQITSCDIKGTRWLVRTLSRLQPQKKCVLVVLDDLRFANKLRWKFRNHRCLEVLPCGWVHDSQQMVDVYNATDVFLMPSRAEAFGLMAIEAMACGVPPIVAEGTALPEIVDAPRCGVAVPYGDVEELGRTINGLLASESQRAEMGRLGRERVEKEYSLELNVQRHIALYEEVIERWKHARPR